jgi:hypothetical protein
MASASVPLATSRSTTTMRDRIACTYCTEGNHFKVMTERDGGAWSRCSQCGHIVMPKERLLQCSCLKCASTCVDDKQRGVRALIRSLHLLTSRCRILKMRRPESQASTE